MNKILEQEKGLEFCFHFRRRVLQGKIGTKNTFPYAMAMAKIITGCLAYLKILFWTCAHYQTFDFGVLPAWKINSEL